MFESALEYCHGYIDNAIQVFQRKLDEPDVDPKELHALLEEVKERVLHQVNQLRAFVSNA